MIQAKVASDQLLDSVAGMSAYKAKNAYLLNNLIFNLDISSFVYANWIFSLRVHALYLVQQIENSPNICSSSICFGSFNSVLLSGLFVAQQPSLMNFEEMG